jgi:hypothetical protein
MVNMGPGFALSEVAFAPNLDHFLAYQVNSNFMTPKA